MTKNNGELKMINLFKSELRTLTAALALGTLSIGFAPAAMAVSTYDAAASFSLTLTGVTDSNGATVTSDWLVEASGDGFVDTDVFGVASADGNFVPAVGSLSISDSVTQSSSAFGSATNGFAWTDTLTDLNIFVGNTSGQDLTFSFSYTALTSAVATTATVGDKATANATIDMLDDLGLVNIFAEADAAAIFGTTLSDASKNIGGIFAFTLMDGGFNNINGFVDSIGSAEAVPVPAAIWLFGSGLLGLVGIARRKQAA